MPGRRYGFPSIMAVQLNKAVLGWWTEKAIGFHDTGSVQPTTSWWLNQPI